MLTSFAFSNLQLLRSFSQENPTEWRILFTEALKEQKIRRFVESSPEALKEQKIRKWKHFRYTKLYLIYHNKLYIYDRTHYDHVHTKIC